MPASFETPDSTTREGELSVVQASENTSETTNAAPKPLIFVRGVKSYHHLRWQSQASQLSWL